MANPFLAEIRICAFTFAPRDWAFCNGQLLPIAQNPALFSLVGTQYGGNGTSNFALPNLQGEAVLCPGQGWGLSSYNPGQKGGTATATLLRSQMPAHTHALNADATAGGVAAPSSTAAFGTVPRGRPPVYTPAANIAALSPAALTTVGGAQPHNNMSPYIVMNFIIALSGIFPTRS